MKVDNVFKFVNIRPPVRASRDGREFLSIREGEATERATGEAAPSAGDGTAALGGDGPGEGTSSADEEVSSGDDQVSSVRPLASRRRDAHEASAQDREPAVGITNPDLSGLQVSVRQVDRMRAQLSNANIDKTRRESLADSRRSFVHDYSRSITRAFGLEDTATGLSPTYQDALIRLYRQYLFEENPDEARIMSALLAAKLHRLATATSEEDFRDRLKHFDDLTIELRELPGTLGPWLQREQSSPKADEGADRRREEDRRTKIEEEKEALRVLDEALASLHRELLGMLAPAPSAKELSSRKTGSPARRVENPGVAPREAGAPQSPSVREQEGAFDTSTPAISLDKLAGPIRRLLAERFEEKSHLTILEWCDVLRAEQRQHYEELTRLLRASRRRSARGLSR